MVHNNCPYKGDDHREPCLWCSHLFFKDRINRDLKKLKNQVNGQKKDKPKKPYSNPRPRWTP